MKSGNIIGLYHVQDVKWLPFDCPGPEENLDPERVLRPVPQNFPKFLRFLSFCLSLRLKFRIQLLNVVTSCIRFGRHGAWCEITDELRILKLKICLTSLWNDLLFRPRFVHRSKTECSNLICESS